MMMCFLPRFGREPSPTRAAPAGDIIIDGGNSFFGTTLIAQRLASRGLHYGLRNERASGAQTRVLPDDRRRTGHRPVRSDPRAGARSGPGSGPTVSTASRGYLHCGPPGAGHFTRWSITASKACRCGRTPKVNIPEVRQRRLTRGRRAPSTRCAIRTTSSIRSGAIAEVWRQRSVVSSWLLDLTAAALSKSFDLASFAAACPTRA